MILICYDGSADAQAAIERVAQLMPGSKATVLVIWETLLETMTRSGSLGAGLGMIGMYSDQESDAAIKQAAVDTSADGTERATTAGLLAQPRIARRHDDIAAVILAVATEVDADLIVLGTRGLSGVPVAAAGQRLARGSPSRRPSCSGGSVCGSRPAATPLEHLGGGPTTELLAGWARHGTTARVQRWRFVCRPEGLRGGALPS